MPSKRSNRNKEIKIASNEFLIMPNKRKMFVSVYAVTRCYGGPEEGGWWYDWYRHVATYPRRVKPCRIVMVHKKLAKQLSDIQDEYDRYSVLGGDDLVIVNERVAGEAASKETPHYE